MTRNSGTPAERPVLALAAEPCSAPEPRGAEQAEQGAELVPVPLAERAAHVVVKAAQELWLHPDRLIHAAWHGNPKTLAQHRAHIKARGWVPPEMTGKAAAFVTVAGIAYHVLIARYVKAACKAVDGSADYPLRFLGLLVFLAILFVLLFVL